MDSSTKIHHKGCQLPVNSSGQASDNDAFTKLQDGAPCHTARILTQWIHQQDFQLLEGWPGNSPDLNPIENCRSQLKKRVAELQPKGTADLIENLKIVWSQQVSSGYCRQLLDLMPARIMAVLAANCETNTILTLLQIYNHF